jgi:transcription initiation factor TFIIIB Brf1 subunit/transcription initiation factor TFIIB
VGIRQREATTLEENQVFLRVKDREKRNQSTQVKEIERYIALLIPSRMDETAASISKQDRTLQIVINAVPNKK